MNKEGNILILKMILRITGLSQERLANILDVTRTTINSWINEGNISYTSKQKISEKFGFPISFFEIPINTNREVHSVIYSTIYNNWLKNKSNDIEESIYEKILNEIESNNLNSNNDNEISKELIIDGLKNGYDPYTGEVFPDNHLLNRKEVKELLATIKFNIPKKTSLIDKTTLNNEQLKLYELLRQWRREQRSKEGFYAEYMVFNNSELATIAYNKIEKIEDLKKIPGIGEKKFLKYANDLYNIIYDFYNNSNKSDDTYYDDEDFLNLTTTIPI